MRKNIGVMLFGMLFSFTAFLATQAKATTIHALQSSACNIRSMSPTTDFYSCGLQTGSDFPISKLTTAYFDFQVTDAAGSGLNLWLLAETYNGASSYSDNAFHGNLSMGYHDVSVTPVHVLNATSPYDYLAMQISPTNFLLGVGLLSSQ
jgi:hypothetical protein